MSIAAATRQAYVVEADSQDTSFRAAAAQPDVESSLERIAQWIPTEAVGIYIALLGLITPDDADARWILFGIGVLLVVLFLVLNTALVNKRGAEEWKKQGKTGTPPKLAGKRLRALLLLTLTAFVAWACALPATPFLDWWSDATVLGGAAVIVLAPFYPKVAELLDIKMPQP